MDNIMQIPYEVEDHAATLAEIESNGWSVLSNTMIDIVDGRYTNCFFIVDTQPTPSPQELLALQDQLILDLTFENLMLKEGIEL